MSACIYVCKYTYIDINIRRTYEYATRRLSALIHEKCACAVYSRRIVSVATGSCRVPIEIDTSARRRNNALRKLILIGFMTKPKLNRYLLRKWIYSLHRYEVDKLKKSIMFILCSYNRLHNNMFENIGTALYKKSSYSHYF